ncbi:Pycsar system effector family protein [Spirosoma endophyticum]|uniref:Pycsar effector protein domain-containing protein n=1 Tax=Spirosoma endophyticum TaxID=662367 RepID=A0A1I2B864_9BACT|nr:Pycsar system effector family protein [Spirosoma endophyticum]SFE52259.1 hypothetical protein SAMN05216167_11519 [Spirosoma endophyticum]
MSDEELIEQARFIIGRYDHYYESVNTKGNLYLAINAILIGGIASSYSFLEQKLKFTSAHNLVIAGVVILCAFSLGFTILAINPFTRSSSHPGNVSLIFFGQVASLEYRYFARKFRKRSASLHLQDMLRQMHILSIGLSRKFKRLNYAGWLLSGSLMLLVFLSLYFILNGK